MADWIIIDNDDKNKLNPGLFSRYNFNSRYEFEDMENCDLPPPLTVHEGLQRTIEVPPPPRPPSKKEEDHDGKDTWGLSEALRLAQSRARKAEEILGKLSKEIDDISKLLIKESMESFAHKQWLKVMEFRIAKLQNQLEDHGGCGSNDMAWYLALAFCLGISVGCGVKFFGNTYIF